MVKRKASDEDNTAMFLVDNLISCLYIQTSNTRQPSNTRRHQSHFAQRDILPFWQSGVKQDGGRASGGGDIGETFRCWWCDALVQTSQAVRHIVVTHWCRHRSHTGIPPNTSENQVNKP